MFIEYRLLRSFFFFFFLAEAAYVLKPIDKSQDQSGIAGIALGTVTRVMMSNWVMVPKEIPKGMEILSSSRNELKDASESSKKFDESMRDSYGDQLHTVAPQVIWGMFAAATDADSAKAAWMQNARVFAVAVMNRIVKEACVDTIDDILESLVHLGLKD